MKGKVYLVGAGPGDPELLTLKALRLLHTAEAVLYDDLVTSEILALIPATAQLHNVGKRAGGKKISQQEINFLMIGLSESCRQVVRLKSGDPLIFGRAGEEIEALRQAGVPYEVVPGITSVLGAAAAAEIPLTHRHTSSAVVFLTAHQAAESHPTDWHKLVASGATLVIYMPGRNYGELAARVVASGVTGETPCVLVSRATTAEQQTHRTTISNLHTAPYLPAPTLVVVGDVVRLARTHLSSSLAVETFPVLDAIHSTDSEGPTA
jgi:uroporphyrin-III C-methyltransferase